jgi:A/G-specific adenine glycosylase
MLQQTQVSTVIPYYQRFIAAFPSVPALAKAPEQEVLRMWEGLGYYRRARALHAAARQLTRDHRGQVPREPAALGALPGIGRYTVGAILSQAFDRPMPILEANSTRVLCRWFACRADPKRGPIQRWLWEAAERLLPTKRVGEFNQALMELGALVCTPTQPKCRLCPVAEVCAARFKGLQKRLPRKAAQPRTTQVREAAVVIRRDERVLLAQRPHDAPRWADLWEVPHGELRAAESPDAGAVRIMRELTGLRAALGERSITIRHGVTRFAITMTCFAARHTGGRFRSSFYSRGVWVRPEALGNYPLSASQRRLAQRLYELA